jgi:elongation factor Ts
MAISAKMVNELRQKTSAGIMDCKRALTETDGVMDKAIIYLREKGMASAGKKSARVAADGAIEIKVTDDIRCGAMAEVNCETDFVAVGEDFLNFSGRVADTVLETRSDLDLVALFEDIRKAVVTKTGENVVVRRAVRFELPADIQGKIESYLHMGGKIGVLVEVACEKQEVVKNEEFNAFCREIAMHIAAAATEFLKSDEIGEAEREAEKSIYRNQALAEGKPAAIVEKMIEGRLKKWYGEMCLLDQAWVREPKQTIDDVRKEAVSKVGCNIEIRRFVRFQLGEGIEKKESDLAAEVKAQLEAAN